MSIIQDNTVLLVGSAVSMFAPVAGGVGLPTGLAVVRKLLGELFPDWYGKDAVFTKLVDQTPFEQLLEHYPHQAHLKATFSRFFDTKEFNPIHGVLADEVLSGSVKAIVSTNYDRCIEGAFANKGLSFCVIATADEDRSQFPLFKIHGTAESKDTIVATLGTEYCLPDWKMELLGSLINGSHLVVLGYSGRDFDICPAIFSPLLHPLWWRRLNGLERAVKTCVACFRWQSSQRFPAMSRWRDREVGGGLRRSSLCDEEGRDWRSGRELRQNADIVAPI